MEKMEAQTQTSAQATQPQGTQNEQPSKPSSCTKIMAIVNLVSRILTFIFLLIALIVLATDNVTISSDFLEARIRFQDVKAYRYVIAVICIGIVYTLMQTGFVLFHVITGSRVSKSKAMLIFDFYADKVISGFLATAVGAGFGATIDLQDQVGGISEFFDKGVAVSSLLLFAFLFNEASQIVSSYALPNCQ